MSEDIGSLTIKGYTKFSLHIAFVTFSFIGSLASPQKTLLQCLKNMEFNLLIRESNLRILRKFEMLIFEMALVLSYSIYIFLIL